MKKIFSIFLVLTFLVTLIACDTRVKHQVKVKKFEYDEHGTSIEIVELEIEDKEEEIKGKIFISIRESKEKKDKETIEKTLEELNDEEEKKKITFSNLEEGKTYNIRIRTTISGKNVVIYEKVGITTKKPENKDIETIQDFFNINNNLNYIYNLKNDLDFSTVTQEEIDSNVLRTFSGEFHGNGYTIKNYKTTKSNTSIGLFGQLSRNAVVENLVIENAEINISTGEKDSYVTGSRYAGILFGQASSTSAIVKDITIKDSKINAPKINSESNYIKVGLLGGVSTANIENIKIIGDNEINVTQKRIGTTRIGGLLGEYSPNDNNSIKDVVVEGSINFKVEQDKDRGLRGKKNDIYIGGVVGDTRHTSYENILSKVDIDVEKLEYKIVSQTYREDKDKGDIILSLNVGGLFGYSSSAPIENALYEGEINVATYELENLLTEKVEEEDDEEEKEVTVEIDYDYILVIYVGSLIGDFKGDSSYLNKVLLVDDNLTVGEEKDNAIINSGILFGKGRDVVYNNETNRFGYIGEANDLGIRLFEKITDLLDSENFVVKNYK